MVQIREDGASSKYSVITSKYTDKEQLKLDDMSKSSDLQKKSIWLVAKSYDTDGVAGLSGTELDKMIKAVDGLGEDDEKDTAKASAIKAFITNLYNKVTGKVEEPNNADLIKAKDGKTEVVVDKWDNDPSKNNCIERIVKNNYGMDENDPNFKNVCNAIVEYNKQKGNSHITLDLIWTGETIHLPTLDKEGKIVDGAKDSVKEETISAEDAEKIAKSEEDKKVKEQDEKVKEEDETSNASDQTKCDQEKVKNATDDLFKAIKGAGTNEKLMNNALAGLNKAELEEVKKLYEKEHGKSLKDAIDGDTSGYAQEVLDAYLENGGKGIDNFDAKKQADKLKVALTSPVDKATALSVITSANADQMNKLVTEYPELKNDLKALGSGDGYDSLKTIIDKKVEIATNKSNKITTAAENIFASVDGAGTDEALMNKTLAALNPEELAKLETVYKEKYGKSLKDAIDGDTSDFAQDALDAYLENKGKGIDGFNAADKAKELKTALNASSIEENKKKIVEILTKASPEQLKEIKELYPSLTSDLSNLSSNWGIDGTNTLKAILEAKLK